MKSITFPEINFLTLFFLSISNNTEHVVCCGEMHIGKNTESRVFFPAEVPVRPTTPSSSCMPRRSAYASHCGKCFL